MLTLILDIVTTEGPSTILELRSELERRLARPIDFETIEVRLGMLINTGQIHAEFRRGVLLYTTERPPCFTSTRSPFAEVVSLVSPPKTSRN